MLGWKSGNDSTWAIFLHLRGVSFLNFRRSPLLFSFSVFFLVRVCAFSFVFSLAFCPIGIALDLAFCDGQTGSGDPSFLLFRPPSLSLKEREVYSLRFCVV
jgi:hypothetical protein